LSLWKYEIQVINSIEDQERKEALWELGRRGWELVSVLPGDYVNGEAQAPDKCTLFLKREATHDINF